MRNVLRHPLCWLQCLALVAGLVPATVVQAHPHGWIYVATIFDTNDSGLITQVRQKWFYDDLLSDALLDGLKQTSDTGEADIQAYADETIGNLAPFHYFTRVTVAGQEVPVGQVTQYEAGVADDNLWLTFTLPLAQPVDAHNDELVLAIFDPTYFIEMLQLPEQPPAVAGPAGARCSTKIEYPNPSPKDYARALALDSGQKAEPEFGALFAEKVHVQCQ